MRLVLSWAALICLFALEVEGVQRPARGVELRNLVHFPSVDAAGVLRLEPKEGFSVFSELPDFTKELGDLKKALTGRAEDASRQMQLARLYELQGDHAKMYAALERARAGLQQQLERQQLDASLMTELGQVLRALGRSTEAEARLREAVQLDPGEWSCWLALGRYCKSAAFEQLALVRLERVDASYLRTLKRALDRGPAPSRLERAAEYLREGSKAFEKAVATVPAREPKNSAAVHYEYGLFLSAKESLLTGIGELRRGEIRQEKLQAALANEEVLDQFRKAAQANPDEPKFAASAAVVQVLNELFKGEQSDLNPDLLRDPWPRLSGSARDRAASWLQRLEAFEGDPDKSAGALWAAGVLRRELMRDLGGAERDFRRAHDLKPESERAFQLLCESLLAGRKYAEVIELCEERNQSKPTVRSRIYAAMALDQTGELEDASAQLDAALQAQPADFLANLCAAVVNLKREDWVWRAGRIQENLNKAERALTTTSPRQQWIEFALAQGLFLAMQDKEDAARRVLKGVLAINRENAQAKDILAIVGY